MIQDQIVLTPQPHQLKILNSKKRYILAVSGVQAGKCIKFDTKISGTRIDEFGFEKGTDQLYLVGDSLSATGGHVLLTPSGFLSVSDLIKKPQPLFYSILQDSNSDISLSDFLSGDLSSYKTISDFQSDYLAYFRSRGGQPRSLKEYARDGSPLPDDALAAWCSSLYELEHSRPYQSVAPLSILGDLHPLSRVYGIQAPKDAPASERSPLSIREYRLSDLPLKLRTKVLSKVPRQYKSSVAFVSLVMFTNFNIYSIVVTVNAPIVKDEVASYWDTSIPQIHCYEAGGFISHNTWTGCVWTYQEITRKPKGTFLIGAPNYKTLEQSTMHKFFELFPKKMMGHFDRQRMILTGKSGFTIYFRSLDDPDSIEGITADAVWLDEAGKMKRQAWVNALGRVSKTGGRILLTTTPYNLQFVYTDIYKPWKEKDVEHGYNDIDVIQFSSPTNKYFPKESYEQGKRLLSTAEFERRYNGSFTRLKGLVYDDIFDIAGDFKEGVLIDELPEFEYIVGGIDWGYEDPAVLIGVGVSTEGHVYVMDEFYRSKLDVTEFRRMAQDFRLGNKVGYYYADKSRPENVKFFNSGGIPTNKANNDINWGISIIRSLIKAKKLHIHTRCVNLLEEFRSYQMEEDDAKKELPVDENNHALDALRYAIASHPSIPLLVKEDENVVLQGKDSRTQEIWALVDRDMKQAEEQQIATHPDYDSYYDSIGDNSI